MRQRLPLVLASASPRRRAILSQLGVAFEVLPSDVDESVRRGEEPAAYAERVALDKALACPAGGRAVLAADTCVTIDGAALGKPQNATEAERMVLALGGRTHSVLTALALVTPAAAPRTCTVATRVTFRGVDAATARRYVATGEGLDKAGAYAIQGLGSGLVRSIEGSYTNVVGLPSVETLELLAEAGVLEEWP